MAVRRTGLARARKAAGFTQESLAEALGIDRSTVVRWEAGATEPVPYLRSKLAALLQVDQHELDVLLRPPVVALPTTGTAWHGPLTSEEAEVEALELARRAGASDVGNETLTRLESAVDDLAIAYPKTPPRVLLGRIRQHLGYTSGLLDARKTLAEHRRLLVVGGWLSLLGATVHIDLGQPTVATARLKTASILARHAGHDEIHAWCFETEAWRALTAREYPHAVELSLAAQALAPTRSSAAVQATAQEGRAWARLGQPNEARAAISKVQRLVAPMRRPEQPEHHYRYDPDKAVAYAATTLAWIRDPAAEDHAREVIRRLSSVDDTGTWPRRVATAHIDLALTLLATNRPDEASAHTMRAIASGRVVPSTQWRAAEVIEAIEARELPEAVELREAYEEMRRTFANDL